MGGTRLESANIQSIERATELLLPYIARRARLSPPE